MGQKKQVSIYEAKAKLSQLIQEALEGKEIIIAKSRKPLVKLVVIEREEAKAWDALGMYEGEMEIPKDFDAPLEDLKEYM